MALSSGVKHISDFEDVLSQTSCELGVVGGRFRAIAELLGDDIFDGSPDAPEHFCYLIGLVMLIRDFLCSRASGNSFGQAGHGFQ